MAYPLSGLSNVTVKKAEQAHELSFSYFQSIGFTLYLIAFRQY